MSIAVTGVIQKDEILVPEENLLPRASGLADPIDGLNRANTVSAGARPDQLASISIGE